MRKREREKVSMSVDEGFDIISLFFFFFFLLPTPRRDDGGGEGGGDKTPR